MIDSPDSFIALCDQLGVHTCCGAELGDCRCDDEDDDRLVPDASAVAEILADTRLMLRGSL